MTERKESSANDTLSEFSDSSNEFYVDEIKERRRGAQKERRKRKAPPRDRKADGKGHGG